MQVLLSPCVAVAGWARCSMEGGEEMKGGTPSIPPAQRGNTSVFLCSSPHECDTIFLWSRCRRFLLPLWSWCRHDSATRRDPLHRSSPGLFQTAARQSDVLLETTEYQRRNGHCLQLLSPSLSLFLGLLLHSFPQGCWPELPSPFERS